MEKPSAPALKKQFRTVKAPPPGSRIRFAGKASRGLTQADVDRLLAAPPGAPTTAGDEGVWGTDEAAVTTGYGTVTSARLKRTADKDVYPNGTGEVIGYVWYNHRSEGSFSALVPSSITSLDAGDTFEVAGVTLCVDSAEFQWEHRGWKKYDVQGMIHDTVSLT